MKNSIDPHNTKIKKAIVIGVLSSLLVGITELILTDLHLGGLSNVNPLPGGAVSFMALTSFLLSAIWIKDGWGGKIAYGLLAILAGAAAICLFIILLLFTLKFN